MSNGQLKIDYKRFIEENFSLLDYKTQQPIRMSFNNVQDIYYEMLLKDYENMEGVREIILKARREGLSSFVLALFTVDFLVRPYSVSLCISHKKEVTERLLKQVKFYVESFVAKRNEKYKAEGKPLIAMSDMFSSETKGAIVNKQNKAEFYIGTAGAKVGGRGSHARNIHFSEAAFYQDTEKVTAEEMIAGTLQQTPPGVGMVFIESTANGEGNYYHAEWQRAYVDRNSSFHPRFFSWELFYSEKEIAARRGEFANEMMFKQEYPRCVPGDTWISDGDFAGKIQDHPEKIDNGLAQTYTITTRKGYQLRATENHGIYDGTQYKPLHSYIVGDEVALLPPNAGEGLQTQNIDLGFQSITSSVTIDELWGEFLGLYMGDGSLSGRHQQYTLSLVMDKQDEDMITRSKSIITKLFAEPHTRVVGSKLGGVEVRVSNRYLSQLFRELDLVYQNGSQQYKRRVHVPEYIKNSPRTVVRRFLKGIFETDGFVGKDTPRIVLFSKHEEFLRDIQLLLLSFGITARIVVANKTNAAGYTYIGRELRLNGAEVRKFRDEIGFLSQRKADRLNAFAFSRAKPIELKDTIVSIEKGAIERVYNITTEKGYYSANGIWTHNSPEEAFRVSGSPFFDMQILAAMLEKKATPVQQGRLAADGLFL